VDFAKTGIHAEIPDKLRPSEYPDFMGKTDRPSYRSVKVLGVMYRHIKGLVDGPEQDHEIPGPAVALDEDLSNVEGWQWYKGDAELAYKRYSSRLSAIMSAYGIKSEAQITTGKIQSIHGYMGTETVSWTSTRFFLNPMR
jgi:RNA-dependent RNA polymerase